jgi:hypothetical protein
MGSEIIAIIFIPGIYLFCRLCYLVLTVSNPERAIYFIALQVALALGVIGMLNSFLPSIPENYNTSFLLGWFMIKTSFWLIILYPIAKLCVYLKHRATIQRVS